MGRDSSLRAQEHIQGEQEEQGRAVLWTGGGRHPFLEAVVGPEVWGHKDPALPPLQLPAGGARSTKAV